MLLIMKRSISLSKYLLLLFCLPLLLGFSHNPKYITESLEYHIVRKDETLYSISKKHKTTVEDLKRINHLDSNKILIGQKIYLQDRESTAEFYVTIRAIPKCGFHLVHKGETLYRISKMYGLTIIDLMNYNHLSSYTIIPGDKILLKLGSETYSQTPKKVIEKSTESPKTKITQDTKYHIVKKGETLFGVAQQNKLSVYELKDYNNLASNTIFTGQKLYLNPQKNSTEKYLKKPKKLSKNEFKKYGLIWPCKGIITSPFGLQDGKPHNGLDIAASNGTPIKSVLDGEVAYSDWQRGYGNVLILKHDNGLMTVYAHNKKNIANKGEKITKGQTIAQVGSTGNSTGSHLHFEVRLQGRAMNPQFFLP
ncbi:MAG: LysM peptidoglycan-binding domain-containing protein [Candidatus Cloacimonadota bacterium]|nr:LysM peptidoglycan-binding domain-containing protein [Candidatus Cloacimonadota bacterium]